MKALKSLVLGLLVFATGASAQVRPTYFNYQDLYAYLPGVWMTNNPDRPQLTISYSGGQLWGSVTVEQTNSWNEVIGTYEKQAEPIQYIGQNLIEFSGEQYFIQLVPSAYDRDYELELKYVGRSYDGRRYGYNDGVDFTSATKDFFAYINVGRSCSIGMYYSYDYARCIRIAAYTRIPSCVIRPTYVTVVRPRYAFEYRVFTSPRYSSTSRYRAGSAYNPDPRRTRVVTPRPVPARPPVIVTPPRGSDRRRTTPPVIVVPRRDDDRRDDRRGDDRRGDDRRDDRGSRGGRGSVGPGTGSGGRTVTPAPAPAHRGGRRGSN